MGDTRLEPVVLSEAERLTLGSWAKRRSTAQGLAVRARIVPACANGWNNTVAAARLGVGRDTVRRWRTRFLARRLDGLADEPRPGVRACSTRRPPPAALAVPSAYLPLTAFAATAAVLAAALNGVRRAARPAVEELRDL